MLYNMCLSCFVMLYNKICYNMCHVMYVMLYNMCHVMLYNMGEK